MSVGHEDINTVGEAIEHIDEEVAELKSKHGKHLEKKQIEAKAMAEASKIFEVMNTPFVKEVREVILKGKLKLIDKWEKDCYETAERNYEETKAKLEDKAKQAYHDPEVKLDEIEWLIDEVTK